MQTLRPYQTEAVEAVFSAIGNGLNRVMYTLPTGAGKTTTFAEIVREELEREGRVLILAHRTELIQQAYNRVKDHCDLGTWEIGTEIGKYRAMQVCKVIVGSVQTCMKTGRPAEGWSPTLIITDECHHASAKSYQKIFTRYGVYDGTCAHVGCTATAKRTDRLSLYAEKPDGSIVMLERKGKPARPATHEESVYQRHVYDYGILPAVEDGWLVPLRGITVSTETDLNGVESDSEDFKEGQLAQAVDTAERTVQVINAWKEIASDRPTLVFCASVEHAVHAAELWEQAGYVAREIDGETDGYDRENAFRDFHSGKVQIITNMGIATEGTDLPACSCIVHLRPTKSWNLYCQMTGRGTRVSPGILDAIQAAGLEAERVSAIAASIKPDCLVIDAVDLYEKCGDLCSVPSILDLPVKLDLQGHSLTEAKKLLDEFEEVRERVIGECPTTFTALKVRLEEVNLMRNSGAKSVQDWKATDDGYRFNRVPPGYACKMIPEEDSYRLMVVRTTTGEVLLDRKGKPNGEMKSYLDSAAGHAQRVIDDHRGSLPAPSRGTLEKLTEKQVRVLKVNGHTHQNIDCMPYAKAKALIGSYMQAWIARQKVG